MRLGGRVGRRLRTRRPKDARISGVGGGLRPDARLVDHGWSGPLSRDAKHEASRGQAKQSGAHEGQLIVAEEGPHRTGGEGDGGRAELVRREDPAIDDGEILLAEDAACEVNGRRYGGDPVEAIENDEEDEAKLRTAEHIGKRKQGQST